MKLKGLVIYVLLAVLLFSVSLNFILLDYSKAYYWQLNGVRLDPLGLNSFPQAIETEYASSNESSHIVFFGDSRAAQWPINPIDGVTYTNRGIGAQTSSQVVLRYNEHVAPSSSERSRL